MSTRRPYHGSYRKLVIAFDVGTTYSGVSYSLLDPGVVPHIQGVTRFPAQENVGGDSKIPSIIYYDQSGEVCAIGAEALQPSIIERAEDEDWMKVEWFKLHLQPPSSKASDVAELPPLPANKTVVDIFGDFLAYLYKCAKQYIQDTHASGDLLWESVERHIEFVLSHPNGWEGPEQSKLRRAAVAGGLIPDTTSAQSRIQFVTEGEASLLFCMNNGLASSVIRSGQSVLIVDAGGGTVDLSAYTFASLTPMSVKEIASAECLYQGSVYVSRRAQNFFKVKLQGSRFGHHEEIVNITECFDKSTKRIFKDSSEPAYVKFGSMRDKDPKVDIRGGQLKLKGEDVAGFFEPSIKSIIDAIDRQRKSALSAISAVFLVGGFAASPWLFVKLQEQLQPLGIGFSRPDSHTNKAVADGAVSFYLDRFVSSRVARATYGTDCLTTFDASDPEHLLRSQYVLNRPSGRRVLPDAFAPILLKGTQISEDQEFKSEFCIERTGLSTTFGTIAADIICYKGSAKVPKWIDVDREMFSTLCTVHADTGRVPKTLNARRISLAQRNFYVQEFSIVLLFGLTELKAQICWEEDGEEKRSPATIVYDDEVMKAG